MSRAVQNALRGAVPKTQFFAFGGGLDQISSPLQIKRGRVVDAQNFEASLDGGYQRIKGYERYDGQAKPSAATYSIINVTITGTFAVGNTITGVTSAATAVVVAVVTTGTAYLAVTKVSGTFVNPETLNVAGNPQGTTSSTATVDGASTAALHATYKNLAADQYRTDIAAVPGSGAILGVVHHNDVVYAARNNAGGTAAAIYKSSSTGWTAVALGRQLSFTSGGVTEIVEGNTITGAISGATAVITRVVLTSGTWAAGTAAGKFIFASQTGTFQAENLDVGATLNLATVAGNSTAITLSPSGRFVFVKHNFGGAANTKRIYGCDGVNKGFEFDGTIFVPIDTGMTTDTPTHVIAHKKHLFFSFVGSVQHSGVGTPYVWSVISGATELAMGDTVTGFAIQPGSADGGALAIFTRNRLSILYGSSSSDWQLVPYREEIGAFAHTIQDVGYPMFFDDRGITNLLTAQEYGNFAHNAITNQIRTFANDHRTLILSSCISRDKSQYRVFFSDNYALYITLLGQKVIGMMPQLFVDPARVAFSGELTDGSEMAIFGSDAGFVYELDKGTSFDGDAIEYFFELPFHFPTAPRQRNRYRTGVFEITGNSYATFSFSFHLGYNDGDADVDATQSMASSFVAGSWDTGVWDTGFWDGRTLIPSEVDLSGTSENIALRVNGSSDEYDSFNFHGVILHFTPRRMMR